ncbi:MAG: hypothetical protein OEM64_14725 [Gammaproteobacteria bacterium]|jgi:hypothetical protein|nr:hypothetical protein [Gammaproteobacteria bacterium]MDH3417560.1 hypothetical protein [Gammaproteobacteria bacterium]
MSLKRQFLITVLLVFAASIFPGTVAHADDDAAYGVYDEAAYTQYVEDAMKKLDKLYLDFCDTCGTDTATASQSRQEFLVTVRDLMQYMNSRFDELDPKKGAALSPTESLVSIHALTMLVDILTATQLEQMAAHPYNE